MERSWPLDEEEDVDDVAPCSDWYRRVDPQ